VGASSEEIVGVVGLARLTESTSTTCCCARACRNASSMLEAAMLRVTSLGCMISSVTLNTGPSGSARAMGGCTGGTVGGIGGGCSGWWGVFDLTTCPILPGFVWFFDGLGIEGGAGWWCGGCGLDDLTFFRKCHGWCGYTMCSSDGSAAIAKAIDQGPQGSITD